MMVVTVMLLVGLVFDRSGSCHNRSNCDADCLNGVC